MTKRIPRQDETWAVGKGATIWMKTPVSDRGIIYTLHTIVVVERYGDRTVFDLVSHGRMHRRTWYGNVSRLRCVTEAKRFAQAVFE